MFLVGKLIFVDEVQKVPELLNEVHRLIENKNHRFLLTGSSARKLRSKGVNLLAERAFTCYIYLLVAQETGKDFSVKRAFSHGLLPSIFSHDDPKKYLESYVRSARLITYLVV